VTKALGSRLNTKVVSERETEEQISLNRVVMFVLPLIRWNNSN
jgi:hypothetical protein